MVKQTMQRKNPSFNESYYGFRAFSELLEAAEKQKRHRAEARRQERLVHHHGLRERRGSDTSEDHEEFSSKG